MKKIKVKFIGFWSTFHETDNFILDILKKYYEVEISDSPEYLFCGTSSKEYLDYSCVRIFFTGENTVPDFNLFDYAISFERLDFGDRHLRYPFYLADKYYENDMKLALNKHKFKEEDLKNKTEFCSFVYSNKESDPHRDELFEKISEYKKVNSGGRYKNNVGGPVADKMEFQLKHKFSIASENSYHIGYNTEKLVQSLGALTIPVYWGDPTIGQDFNTKAFINCHEYDSFDKVIERIKEIDENEELYMEMLREPAFHPDFSLENKKKELENFLIHMMNQPYEQAFRKTQYCWGAHYEADAKRHRKMDAMAEKLLKLLPRRR